MTLHAAAVASLPSIHGKPSPADTTALLAWHRDVFGSTTMTSPDGAAGAAGAAGAGGQGGSDGNQGGGDAGEGGQGGQGANGGDGGQGAGGGDGGAGAGGGQGERTFPQSEVNRLMAREKDQGRRAAIAELASKHGVSTDEIETILAAEKEKRDSALTAEQRAERDRQEQARRDADAARERYDLRVERALLRVGGQSLLDNERRVKMVKAALDLPVTASDADIRSALDTLKADDPVLFETTSSDGGGEGAGAPHSSPGGTAPRQRPNADAKARGEARAKALNESRTATSIGSPNV